MSKMIIGIHRGKCKLCGSPVVFGRRYEFGKFLSKDEYNCWCSNEKCVNHTNTNFISTVNVPDWIEVFDDNEMCCRTCKNWQPGIPFTVEDYNRWEHRCTPDGDCRRSSPSVYYFGGCSNSIWPQVDHDTVCGDYEKKI